MFRAILLVAITGVALAKPSWNDLRVTFDVKFWEANAFAKLPRTLDDATAAGWTLKDTQCSTLQQQFRGHRYWYKSDPAVVLLFDKNGFIAGIQTSPKAADYSPTDRQMGPVLKDGDYYSITAYFVDPSTICTPGRTQAEFDKDGTGTDLRLQYGSDPEKDVYLIPHKESDIRTTDWGNGKCLPGMGQHYWFNLSKNMDCDDFKPYCVLYNGGKLNAFCYAVDSVLDYSQRYERANPKGANACCINAPDCFYTDPRFQETSTMHVYLTSTPWLDLCIV